MPTDALTTLLNDILHKTEVYSVSQTKPDDLTLRRMKKDLKEVGKVNRSMAAMALGRIASVVGDVAETIKQHELALDLGDATDPIPTMLYSNSMRTIGYNAESYRLMNTGMNLLPNALLAIGNFIQIAFHAGYYDKVQVCQELLKKQGVTHVAAEAQQFFDEVNDIIITTGLPLSVFPVLAAILEAIQLNNYIGKSVATVDNSNGELFYWAETMADSETIEVMNAQLIAELALLEDVNLENYHIAFRKLDKHEGSTCH
jgi:hypothetical protein